MKKNLPLFVLFILPAICGFSQSQKFFAVTGEQHGSVNWIAFRQFDMNDISDAKTIYTPPATNEVVYDAKTSSPIVSTDSINSQVCSCLNTRMVAAIAYDSKDNRLYYTPMLGNQLRYLDLNTAKPKSYAVTGQLLKNFSDAPGEASVITRMCFASDGFGYALTNDNNHLIRFSTKIKDSIVDLGGLINSDKNTDHSVKEQFKAWGGDLVADAKGYLYLFAIQGSVFKINPKSRVAKYEGNIQNLPLNYTINAAMVSGDSSVVVASSTDTLNYYTVNLITLQASAVSKKSNQVYNVSDFANANFAFSADSAKPKPPVVTPPVIVDTKVRVITYPNPVTGRNFTLLFNNFNKGKYTIQLFATNGKELLKKSFDISASSQTQKIVLPSPVISGEYVVTVLNSDSKKVYTDKIIISN